MTTTADIVILVRQMKVGNALMQTQAELLALDKAGNTAAAGGMSRMATIGARVGQVLTSAVVTGLVAAGAAAIKFGIDSEKAFREFDEQAREVLTLLPDKSEAAFGDMKEQALELGTAVGRLPEEILPALYQAVSLGVPQDNMFDAVKIASDAARAGTADLTETLVAGQSVVNAYGGEMYSLTDVYDVMFTMIKNGAITMDDLGSEFSKVTSVAGESRVPLEDIGAALVVMTRGGDSAGEAFELLSLLLMQLGIEGSAAATAFRDSWGGSFRDFIAQGGTLAEALQLMENRAKDTGQSLAGMIGGDSPFYRDFQAARAAMELTGFYMDDLIEQTDEFKGSAGAMGEAAAIMSDSVQLSVDKMKAAFEEYKISVGETIGPWFQEKAEQATEIFKALSGNLARNTREMIDSNIENAGSIEELIEAGEKLKQTYLDIGPAGRRVTRTNDELEAGMLRTVEAIAANSDSMEDFEAAIHAVIGPNDLLIAGLGIIDGQVTNYTKSIYEQVRAQETARTEAELWAAQLEKLGTTGYIPAGHVADQFTYTLEQQALNMADNEMRAEQMARGLGMVQEAEEKAIPPTKELKEEYKRLKEAAADLSDVFGGLAGNVASYFKEALNSTEASKSMEEMLLDAAIAAELNIDILKQLAEDTGLYTEEQIEAAVATQQMQVNTMLASEAAATYGLTIGQTKTILDLLNDGVIDGQESLERWSRQLEQAQDPLVQQTDAVLTAKMGFDEYTDSVMRVPTEVETKIISDTAEAMGSLERLEEKLFGIPDRTVTVTTVYTEQGNPPPGAGGYQDAPENIPPDATASKGGRFIVPREFRNDSFRLNVDAGEEVTVRTIAQQMREKARYNSLMNGELGSGGGGGQVVDNSTNLFVINNRSDAGMATAMIMENRHRMLNEFLQGNQ